MPKNKADSAEIRYAQTAFEAVYVTFKNPGRFKACADADSSELQREQQD
jgi:hypothetical protein